jgi:3-deoxy-D-manno-octulosonate 8-phosphate phosphatase (KDO 8-P phosphatase)
MDVAERARRVKLLVLDVDGVLTDGRLFYGPTGEVIKTFHVRDGYGLKQWHEAGGKSAIISGRRSEIVESRARELGIAYVFQGRDDKAAAFAELLAETKVTAQESCFIGDDSLDVPVLTQVGFAVAVADAHVDATTAAHFITKLAGGWGAVREVTDTLIAARNGSR